MKRRAGFAAWNAWSVATTFLLVQTESLVAIQQPTRQCRDITRQGRRRLPLYSSSQPPDSTTDVENSLNKDAPHEGDGPSALIVEADSNGSSEMDQVAEASLSKGPNGVKEAAPISIWPSFDTLDKKISIIALPCIANFAINPVVGAVDLFWVNQMKSALAVAGQAAANQVFSSAFWIVSVLPSVTATLVSKANAKGDKEELQDAVCQALVVGFGISLLGSALMLLYPERILSSILKPGAKAMQYARPYLFIRSFAFLPSLVSLIGFSAFRGTMDTSTPLKISLCSNALNAILDPILMFPLKMGVVGAALATLFSEIVSGGSFIYLMMKRNMMSWKKIMRVPSWDQLRPLLEGGAALQMRNVALNLTFLMVARVVQSLDETGVSAAAHAMAIQTFQLGGVVLLALSVVAQTMVPNELVEKVDEATGQIEGGKRAAKNVANRLMSWGFVLGIALGGLQLLMLPLLQKSSPLEEVRKAAVIPSILASLYQVINGLVFIGEGVMVGCGNFLQLSLSTVVSTSFCLAALNTLPKSFGLAGVWMSFGVFNVARLIGVWLHQTRFGPLSKRSLAEQKRTQ